MSAKCHLNFPLGAAKNNNSSISILLIIDAIPLLLLTSKVVKDASSLVEDHYSVTNSSNIFSLQGYIFHAN